MNISTHKFSAGVFALLVGMIVNSAELDKDLQLSPESKALINEFKQSIKPTLVNIVNNTSSKHDYDQFKGAIEIPQKKISDGGLVLDFSTQNLGVSVLAVRSESAADNAGISANDIIQSINDTATADMSAEQITKELANNDVIKITLLSKGQKKTVNMVNKQLIIPNVRMLINHGDSITSKNEISPDLTIEEQSCGRLSWDTLTREHKRLYSLRVLRINGENVNRRIDNLRLEPGVYTLEVQSFIEKSPFKTIPTRAARPNIMTILIKPNVKYDIMARLLGARYASRNRHWEPIIWRVKDTVCKGISSEDFKPAKI